jgi:hypothetical protein
MRGSSCPGLTHWSNGGHATEPGPMGSLRARGGGGQQLPCVPAVGPDASDVAVKEGAFATASDAVGGRGLRVTRSPYACRAACGRTRRRGQH